MSMADAIRGANTSLKQLWASEAAGRVGVSNSSMRLRSQTSSSAIIIDFSQ